jgi:SSS family solute:Na+ symporter
MFVAVYTFTGGVRAVIAADGVQFLWFSLMIPILLLLAFFKSPASASEVADKAMELTKSGFSGLTTIQIVGIMVSFLLGETLTPPYANRALAAQSETASRQGFVWAGLYCPIWLGICATIGIFGYQFLAPGTAADDVFLGMGKTLLPGVLYGALLAAVLAIVMSSQESLMNSASVALVRDVINLNGKLSDKKQLFFGRAGTMVIAVIAIVVSMYAPSIIDGLLICYSVWAPGLLVPLIFGLYLKRTRPMAGWLSMILGASASIVWQTVLKEPAGIPAILVGLTASLAAYAVGHLLDKKELPLITGENQ